MTGIYYYRERHQTHSTAFVIELGPVANPIPGFPIVSDTAQSTRVDSFSVYANSDLKLDGIIPNLSVSGGVRFTWEKDGATAEKGFAPVFPDGIRESRSDSQPSWQIGMQYKPTEELMAAHRRSWHSGGFNFASPPIEAIGSEGGNMFLPEKVKDVELGFKYAGRSLGVSFQLNVAAYRQWVNNVQRAAQVNLPTGFGAITYNVRGGAEIDGVEVQAEINPTPWLQLGVTGAYTDARYGNPNSDTLFGTFLVFNTFADTPTYSGSAFADVTVPLDHPGGELHLHGDIYAQSEQYFSNGGEAANPGTLFPKYTLVNLRVEWAHVADSNISLSAYMTNAFNQKYYIGGAGQGTSIGLNNAAAGQPRFFGVEGRFDF